MSARMLIALAVPAVLALAPSSSTAQATATPPRPSGTARSERSASTKFPERPVRRDIPMTNSIRRAFAAGTRDSTGRPGRNYWQLWTDYKINARLDSATSVVSGRETVTFRNNSDSAMRSVVLRLDQNIFRPGAARASSLDALTDGMKITRLVINGQTLPVTDTLGTPIPGMTRRMPPLSRTLAQTSARIALSTPIAPHSSGTIEADWSFQVPRIEGPRGFRMGRWADTLYQVAQWYPRVAVFDDLREGGWDTDPYLGNGEFYNNFGHFDVSIDVPAGWIVGATGVLQNPTEVLTPAARERLSHVLESDSTRTIVSAAARGPPRARVLLEALDALRLPAADDGRWTGAGNGIPDVHHVRGFRGGPRNRTRVVADDGRRQRDLVRMDGRGIQSVHEHPLRRRPREAAVQTGQPGHLLRTHQRQRAGAATHVGWKLRRPTLRFSGVR